MKVFVYYNLHKKCWSIRHNGKVIAHMDELHLSDVTFKVSESGRQRVLKQKKKNVHAGAYGTLDKASGIQYTKQVSYNPYRFGHFFEVTNLDPVHKCKGAFLSFGKVWI